MNVSDSLIALFFSEFTSSAIFSTTIFNDSLIKSAFAVSTTSELVNP